MNFKFNGRKRVFKSILSKTDGKVRDVNPEPLPI
jgi:hypothetical protein